MNPNPTRRKLAIATWSAPREGNIYGKLTLDATEARAYIAHARQASGEKVTITHLVGCAVARALAKAPSLNGVIRFGRFVPHRDVSIAFLVVMGEGEDLGKVKIEAADQKTPADMAREVRELAERLRAGKDAAHEGNKPLLRLLPTWVIRPVVHTVGWLTGALGISAMGLEAYPFGSCIITSVGMFGLDEGFAPPTPWAHVPVYVLIGALRDEVVPVGGVPAVRPRLTLTATIDHRFMDGFQGAQLAKTVREVFEDPWQLDRGSGSGR